MREVSTPIFWSTILPWMYWFEPIGAPNCVRFLAKSMHCSIRRCISPTIMMKMQRISQVITCSSMKKAAAGLADQLLLRHAAVGELELADR